VRDVTLDIAPGEFVGIVGPSGSGKTTLIDLLASLLHPQLGSMHIGNVPLSRSQALHWRRHIAYVGQEAFLINDTIRANLVWGCQPQDDATLWRALEQAEIAGTVRAMPLGLDTMLAERGLRLSGGERQRIALARALLRQPSLLILDEASNAIDIATEHKIMTRLAAMDPRPIILIVAHRTETLRVCTRQIMVADGRVVADRGGPQQ
jgi:ATP-binding cassette subfamily C protein